MTRTDRAPTTATGATVATVATVARVVTDVAGIDKEFDYLVPDHMTGSVELGSEVRVPLHGRRVGGWVVGLPAQPPAGIELRPLAKVRGVGPDPEILDLAGWAAWRWAGKRSWFLKTASPGHAVPRLAPVARPARAPAPPPRSPLAVPAAPGVHIMRVAPAIDPTPLVAQAAQAGPILVVVPTAARAVVLAGRLRRAGGDVALLPDEWGRARAGAAAVVIGTASAAWGPCPGLAAAVVLDAHDEGLTAEGAPTWSALTVMAERARRAGVPLLAVTPCPTPELIALGPLHVADRVAERAGWAPVEVIDRRADDPRLGLWSERLVQLVRGAASGHRVALVLNRAGRVRLLACGSCGELARCELCQAAVGSPEAGRLHCPRCGHDRPSVCPRCGSTRFKALRIGVDRARDEIETLAGRPVGEVTASSTTLPADEVVIGTEAVLRRFDPGSGLSAIAFVDFDQELLTPRLRATDEALALLALAARLVRGRAGRVLVQTRLPAHPAVQAALAGDPGLALEGQDDLRRSLRMPPYAAVARIHGEAAAEWVAQVAREAVDGLEVLGPDPAGRWMVKAGDYRALGDALAAIPRPAAGTLRVAVDPGRL
jgi:primosomal protein N' (replication factor Y) (superfamily II helicase)